MFRSAPLASTALLVGDLVSGILPALVIAATARLVGSLAEQSGPPSATPPVLSALAVLTIALAVSRAVNPAIRAMNTAVSQRFSVAVGEAALAAAVALPGLHHLEDPKSSDMFAAARRSGPPSLLVTSLGRAVRDPTTIVSTGLLVAAHVPWGPVLPIVLSVGVAANAWRHAGTRRRAAVVELTNYRRAMYAEAIGNAPGPAREARMFGLGDWALERQRDFFERSVKPLHASHRRELIQGSALSVGRAAAVAAPLIVAFLQLRRGTLDVGGFTTVAMGLSALSSTLLLAENVPAMLRGDLQFLPETFLIVDLPQDDPRMDTSGVRTPPAAPQKGIVFEDVSFTYPAADRPVFTGLNLRIPAGRSLALVGENGAGKSTLVKLLCRLYDPDGGRITLDGIDLREFDLLELRSRIAPVFQDFSRFPLTFRENVGVGSVDRIEDKEFVTAATRHSGALELAQTLPDGMETIVAKEFGGLDLSDGQWQRVGLARAIASRDGRASTIFILDEPTAAMDVRLEHELFERFAELSSGLTTLLISHRFSTVRMADAVAVIENGAVVEEGTHESLVRSGGRYAELFELQARRFRETGEVE